MNKHLERVFSFLDRLADQDGLAYDKEPTAKSAEIHAELVSFCEGRSERDLSESEVKWLKEKTLELFRASVCEEQMGISVSHPTEEEFKKIERLLYFPYPVLMTFDLELQPLETSPNVGEELNPSKLVLVSDIEVRKTPNVQLSMLDLLP